MTKVSPFDRRNEAVCSKSIDQLVIADPAFTSVRIAEFYAFARSINTENSCLRNEVDIIILIPFRSLHYETVISEVPDDTFSQHRPVVWKVSFLCNYCYSSSVVAYPYRFSSTLGCRAAADNYEYLV